MAIQVKASLRKNPQDKKAAGKYYAQVVLAPEMTQRQIIDQIADRCTVTGLADSESSAGRIDDG